MPHNNSSKIPPSLRNILSAPSPANLSRFDPWNSSSTGHQRAENRSAGTAWREIRAQKLAAQRESGTDCNHTGQNGEWKWVTPTHIEHEERRVQGKQDIRSFFGVRKGNSARKPASETKPAQQLAVISTVGKTKEYRTGHAYDGAGSGIEYGNDRALPEIQEPRACWDATPTEISLPSSTHPPVTNKGIFRNLTIYVNGSTFPAVSDHKLKQILVDNGAKISIYLERRKVTHVILGRPNINAKSGRDGCGGGLSGSKLDREVKRVGGQGIKFVGVEWVLESVKAGLRLPEARFSNLHMASARQRSVLDDFGG
ncbi:hypothetical protein LOZ39_001870 [Ophidiomyces ophidiicola]|nr:hypothetical protein LOZ49_000781 [Ophidiomyces ophidiicola]KAI2057777.1 hypothetical protein LOZ44_001260 [Ophidiomyces ophidiicola]KAI2077873.1 hypothetical protein LOZ39_001870 [Ophidiomyces ophidiicola]KAI2141401.1 hypothetical protein LOZ28_002476 [Ophidiomyces ophidiicola]KAI2146424.1 hypothetical protein LOZ29_000181 [Ophidiomyces ophidiicola]